MNLRFAAITIGCMLAGAAGAAYHRMGGWTATSPAAAVPLFMQAATGAPASAAWPPRGSIAFYEETFALLTTTATTRVAAHAPQTPPARDGNAGTVEPPRGNDLIVIRDRFGRPIRVERGDRRLAGPQNYPPPAGPHGPYAPYGPYRR
jgi:hypothetical protein